MNKFTKEELQELWRCVKYMVKGNTTTYSINTIALDKKLRQMIENYCNHKNLVGPLYTINADIPVFGLCFSCGAAVNKHFISDE